MSKYEPLERHLRSATSKELPMSFEDIESILGTSLPPSARKHRAWWSNNPQNSVMTHAWVSAGYRTRQVNLEAESVVFERTEDRPATKARPLFGALKGMIRLEAGTDLTQPADADWARSYD